MGQFENNTLLAFIFIVSVRAARSQERHLSLILEVSFIKRNYVDRPAHLGHTMQQRVKNSILE